VKTTTGDNGSILFGVKFPFGENKIAVRKLTPLERPEPAGTTWNIQDTTWKQPVVALKAPDAVAFVLLPTGSPTQIDLGQEEEAIPSLVQTLKDPSDEVQRKTTDTLVETVRTATEEAVSPLIEALGSQDPKIREGAAYALMRAGKSAPEETTTFLTQALKDPNEEVRRKVASTLGKMGTRQAVFPLVQSLRDPDKLVRWRAAYALVKLMRPAPKETISTLIEALADANKGVRLDAAYALGEIRRAETREALPRLRDIFEKDPSPDVQKAAKQAIDRITSMK